MKNKNLKIIIGTVVVFTALTVIAGLVLKIGGKPQEKPVGGGVASESISQTEQTPAPTATPKATKEPVAPSTEQLKNYKAIWISYLEYQNMNMATKEGFVKDITAVFKNCKDMGLNTVIVHVRPFGDALYKSKIFPQSHLLTGTQGKDPGYDPLEEMVVIAHDMGLRIEAWVNPYRAQLSAKMPENLSQDNPANNKELILETKSGIYYDPGLPEVRDLIVRGVEEIALNYHIDGIHFDDYFYSSTEEAIDKDTYAKYSKGMSLDQWRRENVNQLIQAVYSKIKSIDSNITFGISPQGNNDNNYHQQYSDVKLWLSNPGYADYVMPQLYWGFGYLTKSGRDDFQFAKLAKEWASYKRVNGASLYIGLGAYRIGEGDGGANPQDEWSSGYNLMKMVDTLHGINGIEGFAIYRYENLFGNTKYAQLAQSEVEHLKLAL